MESGKSKPKARFSMRLENGDYLQVAVWPRKSDPTAEVLNVQVRHLSGEEWVTTARLALYRAKDGNYTQLPDRPSTPPPKTSENTSSQNESSAHVA
ncbi:MAG TPA: hypothetical protein VJZ32_02925 [Candidatus Bathyarchaeia archaeon]|nr:hypothetical protein [Candidatus Bathyarchaeia archaeon]